MAASQPFTLVGSGRVGKALADLGAGDDVIIKRGEKVDGPEGPIVVATRNNDLQGVVDATPPERREDLVFIQNGMLQPWLDEKGLGDNTQVLVYFAVAKLGDAPIDGKTDTNPEGLTAAVGKHAEAFAARLSTADLSCKVLDRVEFKKSMLEKLIWICAIMVVGARHGNISVGEVESQHTQEVSDLITELVAGGSAELDVKLDDGVVPRLLAYSRSVAGFPTAVKEFEWRNGWFYEQSKQAMEAGTFDPYPRHTEALKEVGAI
jgi:ketopantoate reductase